MIFEEKIGISYQILSQGAVFFLFLKMSSIYKGA